MDVAALGGRGNEAGHLRRLLPEDAPVGKRVGGGKPRLERVGELRRAVERHAQAVVELAEIGVGGDLARIGRRVEAADLQLENMEDERDADSCIAAVPRLGLRTARTPC